MAYMRGEEFACDPEADRLIDLYHDGYDLRRQGQPRPADPSMAMGWDDAEKASKVRVVMPARPEGYYHTDPKGEDW